MHARKKTLKEVMSTRARKHEVIPTTWWRRLWVEWDLVFTWGLLFTFGFYGLITPFPSISVVGQIYAYTLSGEVVIGTGMAVFGIAVGSYRFQFLGALVNIIAAVTLTVTGIASNGFNAADLRAVLLVAFLLSMIRTIQRRRYARQVVVELKQELAKMHTAITDDGVGQ